MVTAVSWSTAGFQPLIVPSSESKIKMAGAARPFFEMTNSVVGL
jgi:hypothetical protein